MKFWVGVTDNAWFSFLQAGNFDEVNFWQPSAKPPFTNAPLGMPFLFKLKSPNHAIAGGGFFVTYITLPISLAWDVFGPKNGAASLASLQDLLRPLSGGTARLSQEIGCTVLSNPFFLPPEQWLPDPPDWAGNIVRGKFYDDTEPAGAAIWHTMRWHYHGADLPILPAAARGESREPHDIDRYGEPTLVRPRLGQGSFRALVTNAYQRRCAMTGENTLIALEAAHILPYSEQGAHEVSNGLLLRADFHKLFDAGLVSVTPDLRVKVSPRIREAWYNGKVYYHLNDQPLEVLPHNPQDHPNRDYLDWHYRNRFQA